MDWSWIAAVSGFALTMAGTPGPNNTVLTASGARHGFRGTLPYLLGIALGVAMIFFVVAAVGSTLVSNPVARALLKWIGLGYVLWLAWRIGNAVPKSTAHTDTGKPLSVLQGIGFQFVNPKLWTMMAAAVAAYGSRATSESAVIIGVAFGLIFGLATFAGCSAWALLGAQIGRFIATERTMRLFNWIMAALLIASVIPVMVE